MSMIDGGQTVIDSNRMLQFPSVIASKEQMSPRTNSSIT